MHLAVGQEGQIEEGNAVIIYLLVDGEDGVIADAKFQAYGNSALIGAAEVACELLIRKNHDQARRIGADLIDKQVQDKGRKEAFPIETFPHINLVIAAVDAACHECRDLPLPGSYVAPPAPMDLQNLEMGVLEDQVVDLILSQSTVEDVVANYADVLSGAAIADPDQEVEATESEDSKEEAKSDAAE